MKKFFVLFAASILVLCSFSYAEAGPSIDQQYTAGDGSVSIESSLGRFAQTFKPTYTTLEKVEIELTNIVGSKSMSISIRHRTGLNWDTGNVLTTPVQTITNGWNTFDFDNITVGITANDSYGIFTNCSQEGPQWKYSSGPSVFSKGYAIWQSIDKPDWDYNFKTWGSNPVDIVAENTQATDGQNTATGSTETLGTTSASIAKPTTLTAIYSDNGKGVKLNWKASTTVDIDGYKVFRSESASGTPAKIASIAKGTLEYLDIDVITGKTYYYQVRAYKGDSQSVSSNIASATVPADAAPAKPMHLKVVDRTYNMLEVMWRKNSDPKISAYSVNLYQSGEKIRSANIPASAHFYSFLNLDSGTMYKIEVIAKNADGATSTPAITFGFTQWPEAIEQLMDRTRTAAAAAILILFLILAVNTAKHYQKK